MDNIEIPDNKQIIERVGREFLANFERCRELKRYNNEDIWLEKENGKYYIVFEHPNGDLYDPCIRDFSHSAELDFISHLARKRWFTNKHLNQVILFYDIIRNLEKRNKK